MKSMLVLAARFSVSSEEIDSILKPKRQIQMPKLENRTISFSNFCQIWFPAHFRTPLYFTFEINNVIIPSENLHNLIPVVFSVFYV